MIYQVLLAALLCGSALAASRQFHDANPHSAATNLNGEGQPEAVTGFQPGAMAPDAEQEEEEGLECKEDNPDSTAKQIAEARRDCDMDKLAPPVKQRGPGEAPFFNPEFRHNKYQTEFGNMKLLGSERQRTVINGKHGGPTYAHARALDGADSCTFKLVSGPAEWHEVGLSVFSEHRHFKLMYNPVKRTITSSLLGGLVTVLADPENDTLPTIPKYVRGSPVKITLGHNLSVTFEMLGTKLMFPAYKALKEPTGTGVRRSRLETGAPRINIVHLKCTKSDCAAENHRIMKRKCGKIWACCDQKGQPSELKRANITDTEQKRQALCRTYSKSKNHISHGIGVNEFLDARDPLSRNQRKKIIPSSYHVIAHKNGKPIYSGESYVYQSRPIPTYEQPTGVFFTTYMGEPHQRIQIIDGGMTRRRLQGLEAAYAASRRYDLERRL